MTHVPYKTVAAMATELIGGVIQIGFIDAASQLGQLKAGKLRAIAASGPQRLPALPDLPTMTEQGVPFDTAGWYGLFAPGKTPAALVHKLNAELNRILATPEFQAKLREFNTPDGPRTTPEQFRSRIEADIGAYRKIIVGANIKLN